MLATGQSRGLLKAYLRRACRYLVREDLLVKSLGQRITCLTFAHFYAYKVLVQSLDCAV